MPAIFSPVCSTPAWRRIHRARAGDEHARRLRDLRSSKTRAKICTKAPAREIAASEDVVRLPGPALPDGARAAPVAEEGAVRAARFAIAEAG